MVKLPNPAEITLNPECFRNMINLEIFINRNASLCGYINYLPNTLRLIDWGRCQLQSLPPDFQGNHLVEFNMPCSHIRQLDGFKHLSKLTSMNLSGCPFLEKIPDLSGIPNIKYLDLSECTRLVEVHGSVGFLDKLVKLDLSGCVELMRFGTTLGLKSLEELDLSDCESLESFPEIEGEMESLQLLRLSGSGIRGLPPSIAYLTGLRELYLSGCFNLTRFATHRLKSLENLDLSDCKSLESFPEIEVEMESLRFLDISGSGVRELPSSIGYLTGLQYLDLRGCFNLTRFATLGLKSLEELDLSDCKSLESFPEIEVELESLQRLVISGSGVRELPPSIAHLTGLQYLELRGCFNLTRFATLRQKFLKFLDLRDCKSLESFPEIEVEMKSLWFLDISGSGVRELPPSIAYLTGLEELYLSGCFNLTRFATLRLKSLKRLDLRDCKSLESFPEIEVEMKSLRFLDISGSGVRELPPSIAYLTGLQQLYLSGCFNLTILQGFLWSTATELFLSQSNFVNLPISFSKFVNLRNLYLINCQNLLEIREQVLPRRIEFVYLDNCTSLEKIPELPWKDDHTYLSLKNCVRLRGYDITEHIFQNSLFKIILPGDEVPKWFSCCKDATIVRENESGYYEYRCEVSFEIPPNLKWETLRLVLCVVTGAVNFDSAYILRNGKVVNCESYLIQGSQSLFYQEDIELLESHVYLTSIPLLDSRRQSNRHASEEPPTKQVNTCQVIFDLRRKVPAPFTIPCGVHLLGHHVADVSETVVVDHDQHQDCELLSLSLPSKTSLGKRPRQSDYMALHDDHRANVVDIGDHEAEGLTLFTRPSDHQKRRHIDLNEEPKE